VLPFVGRYLLNLTGETSRGADVAQWWESIAEAVLTGTPLYVPPATDNKPPGTYLIAIAGELTGGVDLAFLTLAALGGVLSTWYVFHLTVAITEDRLAGVLAAVLVVLSLSPVLDTPNNKLIVGGLAVAAVAQRRPLLSGLCVGVAGGIVQFGALALPPLAWLWYRRGGRRGLAQVVVGAAVPVAALYLFVLLVWGPRSFVNAVAYTTYDAARYAAVTGQMETIAGDYGRRSLLAQPGGWLHTTGYIMRGLGYLLPVAAIGAVAAVTTSLLRDDRVVAVLALAGLMTATLFVRAYVHYAGLFLGALGVLAGLGLARLRRLNE
jgi:hypothetical protein